MRTVALLALSGLEPAVDVLKVLRAEAPSLQAVDYFEAEGLGHVCRRLQIPRPFPKEHPVYLVVECAARTDPTGELDSVAELVEDAAVAVDEAGRSRLWLYRDAHNETIRSLGVPHKLDVSVPIGSLAPFERDLRLEVGRVAPGAHLILYGHLGDGNVHVNVVGPPPDDERVDEAVLELVVRHGGSISAEHGVGQAKARWLPLSRSEAEIATMQAVKEALDPLGILSRGRLLPS
jgi:FAD/FMN-containing dehydrogenase